MNQKKQKLFSEIPRLKGERILLRALTQEDAGPLKELTESIPVYRYLPTFLYEQKYEDIHYVIRHLYDECFQESIILGIFSDEQFCGLAEFYGYRDPIHKVSVGYRLLQQHWGKGIATEALGLMTDYLDNRTDIEITTASTMVENKASAHVLQKCGFSLVIHDAWEDWGFSEPVAVDKWIR